MLTSIAVFLGGGLGALVRTGAHTLSSTLCGVPWIGTVVVNLVGSLLLGLLWGAVESGLEFDERVQRALSAGFLGALTTFSTFSVETIGLLQAGTPVVAAVNVVLQLAIGLTAAAVGLGLGRLIAQTIG